MNAVFIIFSAILSTYTGIDIHLTGTDILFPPTILGNPVPPYTGFYNGAVLVHMVGKEASITRLSFSLTRPVNYSSFAFKLEVGGARFLSDCSYTIPILMIGAKLRHDFGNIVSSISLSLGIPEIIAPSVEIGEKYQGKEFLTFRGGSISGLAVHYKRFDMAVIINLLATNLDFFSPPSIGLSLGWRLK